MTKGLRLYLTHEERESLRAILHGEAETLKDQLVYDEGWNDVKKQHDLVCSIWNKIHK